MTKRRKIGVGLAFALGGAICLFLLAIIVRQYAVPLYVNTFYRQSVNKGFADSFSDINSELEKLGVVPSRVGEFDPTLPTATCYNHVTDNGQNGTYHGISETVLCQKQVNVRFVPDDDFITAWKTGSGKLIPLLEAHGWKMKKNIVAGSALTTDLQSQQAITKVFDVPSRSPATQHASDIDYSKTNGKVRCLFWLAYANDGPSPVKSFWLTERCQRDVSFFGGSDG